MRSQTEKGASAQEVRERFTQQGFLVYSVKPKSAGLSLSGEIAIPGRRKRLNIEKFLIFNQQFVTLIRAGLPILKALDLLAERLTDPKLTPYINGVRDDVRKGVLLSEAFRLQGIFPKIYVTSVMAGEKSGSLVDVLERFIIYQKLALAVRKKILVSLMYPCVLIVLVILVMVFLVTYVVPSFALLYNSMSAQLPTITIYLISIGHKRPEGVLVYAAAIAAIVALFLWWRRTESAQERIDRVKMKVPLLGVIWIKYQVAQFARVLSTLLTGGIPLMQGLDTAADSLGTPLLRKTLRKSRPDGPGRPDTCFVTRLYRRLSRAGRRHGGGGRIHRRTPRHAHQRGRVLRGRRQYQNDRHSLADRTGHHDLHGLLRRFRADCPLPAHLLSGRYHPLSGWR